MRNSTSVIRRMLLCVFVLAAGMNYAQTPNSIGTDIANGSYVNVNFTAVNGLFSQYRVQATASAAYGIRKLEFPIAVGDYSTVWRAYVSQGDTLSGFNIMIDPVTQTASARYNSGFGGTGIILPAITAGNYYTINVTTDHGNANDTMSVMETTYNPVTITSISIPYDTNAVGPACSPTIVATLSAPPSVGEYVYLRYSTTGFQDSSVVLPMAVSGSTATVQIPAYPAGVHIDYYVLTSTNPSLITTGPGSGYYDSYTLNLQNGTAGNNFRYTVKTLPVPAVSVTAPQTTICQGMVDTFIAHTSNTDTAVTIFQWYKNGNAVGSNDSIYTDATLNNNDSVWVMVTVDFGCPVNDTSNHTIITVNTVPTGTALASPTAICFGDSALAIATPGQYLSGFQGAFDPAVWYASNGGFVLPDYVDTTMAPASITLHSYGQGGGTVTDYTIMTMPFSGVVSFNYQATTGGSDQLSWGISLTSENGTLNGSGTISQNVTAGQQLYFSIESVSPDTSTLTISGIVLQGAAVSWYSAASGGSLLGSLDTLTVTPASAGQDTVYAQLTSVSGCAAARIPVAITVYPFATTVQNDTFCNGDSIIVGTHTYTATGTYIDTFFNASATGCDSIVTTNLIVKQLATFSQSPTLCSDQSIIVGSHTYTASGTYIDTLNGAAVNGCDSIVTTNVTIIPVATFTQNPVICQGGSVTVGPNTYDSTGTYIDTLHAAAANGCDSIVTTNLTVNPLPSGTASAVPSTICFGDTSIAIASPSDPTDTVVWYSAAIGGTNLGTGDSLMVIPTTPGADTVYAQLTSAAGCADTGRLMVAITVLPWTSYTQYDTFCNGGSVTVGTHTYNIQGTYIDTLFNASANGCDSVVTTNLTTIPFTTSSQTDTICSGGTITVGPYSHNATGIYSDTLYNASSMGCDSVVTTNLTVVPQPVSGTLTRNPNNNRVCDGAMVSATATAGSGGFDSTMDVLQYSFDSGPWQPYVSDSLLNTTGHNSLYIETFRTSTGTDCDSSVADTVRWIIVKQPVSGILHNMPHDTSLCVGDSVVANPGAGSGGAGTITDTTLYSLDGGPWMPYTAGTYIYSTGHTSISIETFRSATGAGCDQSTPNEVTYIVNPYPTNNIGTGPITQCGGSVILDAGNPGSTYQWTDGSTNEIDTISTSGQLSVTVTTAPGCASTFSRHANIKPTAVVNLGPDRTLCADSTTLDAGNPGSDYLWTGGDTTEFLTAYTSGTYTVTVTDTASGCTTSDSVQLTFNTPPAVHLSNDTSSCGGTITLDAGNPGDTYLWSDSSTAETLTVSTSGLYSVTVTGGGCSGSGSGFVNIYAIPNLGPDVADSICPGSSADLYNYFTGSGLTLTFNTPTPASVDTGTYTVVGTNSNGCSDTAYVTITYRQAPSLGADQADSVCSGIGVNLIQLYPDSGYTTYDWNTPNPQNAGAGTYQLIVSNASGCADTAVATLVNYLPQAISIMSTDTIQCGGSIVMSVSGSQISYMWSNGDTTSMDTVTMTGTYSVTATNMNGCTASASEMVTIYPQPNLGSDVADSICPGSSADLYNYFAGSGLTLTFNTSTPASVDTGTYTVIGTNSNGCSDTAYVTISYRIKPTLGADQTDSVCSGIGVNLTQLYPDSGYTSYNWNTPNPQSAGAGTYQLIVSNASGCTDTAIATLVNYAPNPVVGLGPDTAQCGGTITLSVFQVKSTYLWSTGDTTSQITVGTTGIYSVTVTNMNGCTASASEMVTIYPKPNLGPDVSDSICPGSTADLYNYYINSGLALTYSTPNPASVDTGTYTIIGTNSNGCSDTAYVTITLRAKPNLGGNKADSICKGYTYDLTTMYPDSGYSSYVWNVSNDTAVGAGTYQLIVTNASGCTDTATATITLRQQPVVTIPSYGNQCITNPAFTMTGATPAGGTYYINYVADSIFNPSALGVGLYHVLYIYTNASGCTDSASENINVWPQPQITDTIGLPSVCTGSPMIDLNNYFSPAGGVFTGPGVSGSIFYPSLAPVGSDSITYIITSQNGCMDTAGQRIDIIPAVKVSLHTDQSNFTICAGQPITFTASGAEFYQFFVNDSAQGPADTINTFTTTALTNHAQVSVIGSNACSSDTSDYIIIDVVTPPVVTAGPDTTIVLGQDVQLYTNASGASSLVYIWTPDSFLNVATIPNPVYSGPDTITFVVKVTDVYGCSDTASVTINVQIPDNIQLPNVITPNGDGKNDVWALNEKIDLAGSHLVILNRWGELVYETYNYANNWGGTYKDSGKKLPDDTYYYVLTVPAQDNHTYKGAINILSSSGN